MLLAPAKLNLTLEVLSKRPDGFHEVRSVLQEIALWDSLSLELKPQGIDLHCSQPNLENRENSALRAGELLHQFTQSAAGVSIGLQKGIPEGAGLGGHSSDAAATLRGLDSLWGVDLGMERLYSLAGQISTDASFFLVGGTASAEGRGEEITPLPPLPLHWAVILKPDLPLPQPKTAHLYSLLQPKHYSHGEHTRQLVAILKAGRVPADISPWLFNTFELVASQAFPGLSQYWERFRLAGAQSVHLAGSGPALFTLTPNREQALKTYNNLQGQGQEVSIAPTRWK